MTNNSASFKIKSESDLKVIGAYYEYRIFERICRPCRNKKFWEASDRLYMNQSTLSKYIKSLENELGINLFLRTTRRVELTNYGQTFLPYFASGLGNGMINMISAAIRQLVLLIPCLWFLIKTLGSTHGWYAFWIAETVACIYSYCISHKLLKNISQ